MSIDGKAAVFSGRQEINISDRKRLTVTGVEDVESFDDKSIILKSNLGMIAVDGEELHISTLKRDSGELIVEGIIGGVVFFEPREASRKRKRGSRENGSAEREKGRGFFA